MSTKDMLIEELSVMSEAHLRALLIIAQDLNSIPNEETAAALEETEQGVNLTGPFSTVEELMEDLNADDKVS